MAAPIPPCARRRPSAPQVEHARYLTVHDLAALTAMQYEHAGLARPGPLVETALLAPARNTGWTRLPKPLVHFAGGEARIALLDRSRGWRRLGAGERRGGGWSPGFERFQMRQRQLAALSRRMASACA